VIISLIAAIDRRGGIGRDGGLPWHLSDDLKHFKWLTTGHHVIMGRHTFEGLGAMLKGRSIIVLSRDPGYSAEGAQVSGSLEEALSIAEAAGEEEAFVVGGAQVFAEALRRADRFYLTRVDAEVEADTQFPDFGEGEWELVESQAFGRGEKNDFDFTIQTLVRVR
jgi:dihydrofolate reductase